MFFKLLLLLLLLFFFFFFLFFLFPSFYGNIDSEKACGDQPVQYVCIYVSNPMLGDVCLQKGPG